MLDELIFFMLMAVGVTYLDNGGPYAGNYGCPAYCAVNHKHVAFKDTLVVISDMAKNNNKSMLGGFFNYLSGRLGTEIDSIPTPAPSFDNLKTMQKNVDDHAEMLLAKSAAVRDMENAGMDVDILPKSDMAFKQAEPDNTKVDMLIKEAGFNVTDNMVDNFLQSQYDRMNLSGASYEDFSDNLKDFAYRVSGVESSYGRNLKELSGSTSAKGLYQFTDASVQTGKQRLKNLNVSDSIISQISDNPLDWTKEQSDLMFFGNMFSQKGSDKYLKSIGESADKDAMIDAYYKFHHTAPDEATEKRALQFFK